MAQKPPLAPQKNRERRRHIKKNLLIKKAFSGAEYGAESPAQKGNDVSPQHDKRGWPAKLVGLLAVSWRGRPSHRAIRLKRQAIGSDSRSRLDLRTRCGPRRCCPPPGPHQ